MQIEVFGETLMETLTKEQIKEQGIKQLKMLAVRWVNQDGEFRQYITRRLDMLKMIGAGNTSGALALAVFLTTGARTASLIIWAKVGVFIFFVGLGSFVLALRNLYRFEQDIEAVLMFLRAGSKPEAKEVKQELSNAIDRSERSALLIAVSLLPFVIGSIICFVALLFS
jgi:hypothetical protein